MPITARLYEKEQAAIAVQVSSLPTQTVTPTTTVTPTISLTPSETPSVSITPSVTATISITPTPSPSIAYYALASKFNCLSTNNDISCGQYIGNSYIWNGASSFTFGKFYASGSFVFQAQDSVSRTDIADVIAGGSSSNYSQIFNLTGYDNCVAACQIAIPSSTPSLTPTKTATPSVTPSITRTPSITPSITPSRSGS